MNYSKEQVNEAYQFMSLSSARFKLDKSNAKYSVAKFICVMGIDYDRFVVELDGALWGNSIDTLLTTAMQAAVSRQLGV